MLWQVTNLFAMMFCNSDANQARALMLPKRSTVKTDYFLLQMVQPWPTLPFIPSFHEDNLG
jgi:hypothetical protein